MQRVVVRELIETLKRLYGSAYRPWGTSETDEEGTGFLIEGIPVFFSVLSFGDIPPDVLDVQITSHETVPESLGYDMYFLEGTYSVKDLVSLVERYRSPMEQWPPCT